MRNSYPECHPRCIYCMLAAATWRALCRAGIMHAGCLAGQLVRQEWETFEDCRGFFKPCLLKY